MTDVVARWSGRQARALREAKRMSVRDYAAHLGITDVALSNMERKGDRAQLRYETQQLLDADLSQASDDVRLRFALLVAERDGDGVRAKSDGARPETDAMSDLGGRSARRTRSLLETAFRSDLGGLIYVPDAGPIQLAQRFLASSTRVFVVKGPAGSGKTSFARHLASVMADDADYQLHSVGPWDDQATDLATEILRYGSLPYGRDSLLDLESACASLTRPCLVIIDGISDPGRLGLVGRQVDAVLRQVTTDALRFLLVIRTPPNANLSSYPVLAASVYEPSASACGWSCTTSAWDLFTAREVWDRSRRCDEPSFTDLPVPVRELVRLPLYMRLLKVAGNRAATEGQSAFHLIGSFVASVLASTGQDADHVVSWLAELARSEAPDMLPSQFDKAVRQTPFVADDPVVPDLSSLSPLVEVSPEQHPTFVHDVVREYFLAMRVATQVATSGRSGAVRVLNDLAGRASINASARGLFEFVVCAVDDQSPELLQEAALAPTLAVDSTLPAMLRIAAGARFGSSRVLRASARRCTTDGGRELTRSLLTQPRLCPALGDNYVDWLLAVLRQFGSAIWSDVADHIDQFFDVELATGFISGADLNASEEATFLARYFFLFVHNEHGQEDLVDSLLGHPDWRVRAAMAAALPEGDAVTRPLVRRVIDQLVADDDYKVRAAAAREMVRAAPASAKGHLPQLIRDANWHVRASAIAGVLRQADATSVPTYARVVLETVLSDPHWRGEPAHVAKLLERLLLVGGQSRSDVPASPARDLALFHLLRELRTGWTAPPEHVRDRLVREGSASSNWRVRQEAAAVVTVTQPRAGAEPPTGARDFRQTYRRLRDGRSIQVALDVTDLPLAVQVATAAASAGVDLIEVGDPLIKAVGVGAVEAVKRAVPQAKLIAEMMSADWGRDQVELAVEAGADAILLIGPTTTASVSAAVAAARRLDAAIVLDVPVAHMTESWIRGMESAGIDGFAITTNIDLGVGVHQPLNRARVVRGWSRLPISVSGGFSATDRGIIDSADWDIMVIGRSVAEAVHPDEAAQQLVSIIRQREGIQ